MQEKIRKLTAATRALLAFIEENQVFDKLADCGCGGVDPYRSDQFESVIREAREALLPMESSGQEEGDSATPAASPRTSACSMRPPA